MTDQQPVPPLHGDDHPPTPIEREIFDRALGELWKHEALPLNVLAIRMVELGVSTIERASLLALAHFEHGGFPPFDDDDHRYRLCWLIQRHASSLSTPELLALIRRRLPQVTVPEITAELRRQSEADQTEADALRDYAAGR